MMEHELDNIERLNRIRACYRRAELTEVNLAKAIGISQPSMNMALRGEASEKTYDLIGAWLKAHEKEYPCPTD